MATTKKVVYQKANDYRFIPVTGAFGGPAPNGEIVVDLYVERFDVPVDSNVVVGDTGIPVESPTPDTPIRRELMIGIVMRPDIAYVLGKFMMEKATAAGFVPPADDRGM